MTRRIIQFGASRFLQTHFYLLHEARLAGQAIGPITLVRTRSGAERRGRIDQALTAAEDWPKIIDLFARDAEFAVSNVGERGRAEDHILPGADAGKRPLDQHAPPYSRCHSSPLGRAAAARIN